MATIIKFQREKIVDYVNLDMVQRVERSIAVKQAEKEWMVLIFENQNHRFSLSSDEPQFQIIIQWLEKNNKT